jgi:hypothetical protein
VAAKRLAVTNASSQESEKILGLLAIRSRGLYDDPAPVRVLLDQKSQWSGRLAYKK